jgi:hypothetical protein
MLCCICQYRLKRVLHTHNGKENKKNYYHFHSRYTHARARARTHADQVLLLLATNSDTPEVRNITARGRFSLMTACLPGSRNGRDCIATSHRMEGVAVRVLAKARYFLFSKPFETASGAHSSPL